MDDEDWMDDEDGEDEDDAPQQTLQDYEIHLTVDSLNKESFIDYCREEGMKYLELELQNLRGASQHDIRGIYQFHGLYGDAIQTLSDHIRTLRRRQVTVVRYEVETSETNPDIETYAIPVQYFETRFAVKVDSDRKILEDIGQSIQDDLVIRPSRNSLEVFEDGSYIQMFTHRTSHWNSEVRRRHDQKVVLTLECSEYDVEKVVSRAIITDSFQNNDSHWIRGHPV